MSTRQIAVITDRRDAHIPFVQKHLSEPIVVLDPLEIAEGKTLSFEYSDKGSHAVVGDTVLNPVSIWFRKPGNLKKSSLHIDPRFQSYAVHAIQKHFATLFTAFPKAYWVSDLFAINRANDKPLQIALAKELGLRVPDTLFTSDADAAKAFVARYDSSIIKPVIPFIEKMGNGRQKTLYATKISSKTMPDLSGLHQSPLIFQEAIDPAYDVRVTVVGSKVFAARIEHEDDTANVRDWRLGHYEGSLAIMPDEEIPKEIVTKCVEHARRLNLNYSAIDLVVDKKGVYWFLENNPNGQWAFVEKETGQPIGKALAELLLAGKG